MIPRRLHFWDNGIRNTLINQFNPLALRDDVGKLRENFMVSEIVKKDQFDETGAMHFFWRTHQQQEIDLVRAIDTNYEAFEFKWSPTRKSKPPESFMNKYPVGAFLQIHRNNDQEILSG